MTPIGIAQSVPAPRWRYGKFCAALPHLIQNIIGYCALNCRNFSKSPIWRQNSKKPGKSKVDFRFSRFFQNDKRKPNFSLDCAFSDVKNFNFDNSAFFQWQIPQNFNRSFRKISRFQHCDRHDTDSVGSPVYRISTSHYNPFREISRSHSVKFHRIIP